MVDDHSDRAEFRLVYIAEAHAVDGWQTTSNEEEGIRIAQHTSHEERLAAARLCHESLGLRLPVLVDGMDDGAAHAYAAWPERIYIITPDGAVHFKGGPGPYEFDPAAARAALESLLDA